MDNVFMYKGEEGIKGHSKQTKQKNNSISS